MAVRFKEDRVLFITIDEQLVGSIGSTFSDYKLMDCSLELGLLKPAELRFTIRREDAANKTKDQVELKPITSNILGKTVYCLWTTVLDNNDPKDKEYGMEFEGIAVEANADKLYITVVACSKDILLNDAPCCASYTDMSVLDVIRATLEKNIVGRKKIDITTDGYTKRKEEYIVRYNETSYQFITRLARQYGLWVYWSLKDKKMAVFEMAKPMYLNKAIPLSVKRGYQNFTYKLKTMYPKIHYAAYNYMKDQITCQNGDKIFSNPLNEQVHNISKSSFIDNDDYKVKNFYDYSVSSNIEIEKEDPQWLTDRVESHNISVASQYVECTGTTNFSNLQIGSVIEIKEKISSLLPNGEYAAPAELVVIGMRYEWDSSGNFIGKFTAIPKDHHKPPYFDPGAYPKSGVQRAVVVDNKDDKGLGRVKVQFLWQATMDCADNADVNKLENKDKKTISPWIRVAQPYAGKGVGCYIIPEIGDEVLIGFEHDNVEKPYVIGVLYHGGAAKENYVAPDEKWAKLPPAADKKPNVVKALRTRSGQTIEIHDDSDEDKDKKGFVRIYTNPLAQNNGSANNNNGNNNGNAAPREYDIVLSKDDWRKANDIDKALKAADAEKVKIGVASDGSIVISCAENLVLKAKNIKIIADETFDMSVAGKTGGKWNDDKEWKDTEFGTKMAIVKNKMEISAVGKDTKMTVTSVEENKAAQKFDLTIGKSSISVDGKKDSEKIDVKANESVVAVNGKNGAEKIEVKAKESFVTVDGKNGAEKIDVKAKESFVTVDGKNDAEKVIIKSKKTGAFVDGKRKIGSIVAEGGHYIAVNGNHKTVAVKTGGSVALKGEKGLTIDGGTDLKINATKAAVETKATLDIKGKTVTVDGGPLLQLKGTSIKNN